MLTQNSFLKPGLSIYQDTCVSPEVILMSRLNELIELHFKIYKNSDFYGNKLGYSVRVLNSITVFHTGSTVYDLIQGRLLIEAKKLLLYSRMPVKRIAYELGFEYADYFGRWFKKLTGSTPKIFRKDIYLKN
jgi:AraC family transcriptional activator of pobA